MLKGLILMIPAFYNGGDLTCNALRHLKASASPRALCPCCLLVARYAEQRVVLTVCQAVSQPLPVTTGRPTTLEGGASGPSCQLLCCHVGPGPGGESGLLWLVTHISLPIAGQTCVDIKDNVVDEGFYFTPKGDDPCLSCTCHRGEPEMCVAALCERPQGCQQYRKDPKECCKFMCLDPGEMASSALRGAACSHGSCDQGL